MEQWKEYRLGEIGKVVGGATPSTKDASNYDGDISWITPKDLSVLTQRYIYRGERMITLKGYNSCSCKLLPKGSVLFSSRAPIGYVAIASKELCTNQGFKSILPFPNIVDSMFLYYLLVNNRKRIEGLGSGTTFKEVSLKVMQNVKVKIPSMNTQHKIASVLSSIDDKIELNRKINSNLEEQAKALFKSWFIDFEPFKDGKFVDSEFGMIPERWNMMSFESFISESQDKAMVGTYPAYSVTNNGITPRTEKFKKQLSKATSKEKILRKNDLVFGMSRQILNWGIMQDEIGSVSSAYHVYKIDKGKTDPTYLRYFIKGYESYFRDLIGTAAREGQSLDKGALMNKKLLVPSKEILRSFIQHVTTIENTISLFKSQCRRLSTLRDTLLPRLMSGEIEVRS